MEISNSQNEILFKKSLEASRNAILITDSRQPDNPIIFCNSAFEELTGYSSEEILGKNCRFLQGDDTDLAQVRSMRDAIQKQEHIRLTIKNYKKDGTMFWNDLMMSPIKDEQGTLTHYIGMQLDVTDAKLLEQSKDDFIGIASHELRTPITSLKLYADILVRQLSEATVSDALKKSASHISNQAEYLSNLLAELLDVSKLESGTLDLYRDQFNINVLVQKCIDEIMHVRKTHSIILDAQEEFVVYADAHRIAQVLTNLIDNAVKYSPGKDKVIVSITKEEKKIKIAVKDYGFGISKRDQEKVFNRFFRTADVKKKDISGFGLGLHISYEIIKQHGEEMKLESTVGIGSEFSFLIPIK